MSADYWGDCPKCKQQDCLREDWDIGTNRQAVFVVFYSCRCEECKFSFTFQHKELINQEDQEDHE